MKKQDIHAKIRNKNQEKCTNKPDYPIRQSNFSMPDFFDPVWNMFSFQKSYPKLMF